MKQTNSSLRQALEGGIDPLRPPEVSCCPPPRVLGVGAGRRAAVTVSDWSPKSLLVLQANTKFNSRWTTDEQLLAVQGGSSGLVQKSSMDERF